MITIVKGSKEYLPVKVTDAIGDVTTLVGLGTAFDVHRNDLAETQIISNQAAAIHPTQLMVALCLVDTTLAAFTEDEYNLFLEFVAAPEIPRLGPFRFRVDD